MNLLFVIDKVAISLFKCDQPPYSGSYPYKRSWDLRLFFIKRNLTKNAISSSC